MKENVNKSLEFLKYEDIFEKKENNPQNESKK